MKAGLYLSSFMGLLLLGCGEDVAVLPGLNCAPGHEQVGDVCVVKEIYFEGGWFTMGRGYCDPPEEHAADFESGRCALPDRPPS